MNRVFQSVLFLAYANSSAVGVFWSYWEVRLHSEYQAESKAEVFFRYSVRGSSTWVGCVNLFTSAVLHRKVDRQ